MMDNIMYWASIGTTTVGIWLAVVGVFLIIGIALIYVGMPEEGRVIIAIGNKMFPFGSGDT
jgi:hypothetical protein